MTTEPTPIDHLAEAAAYADDAFTNLVATRSDPAPPIAPPRRPPAVRAGPAPVVPDPPAPLPPPTTRPGEPTRKRLGLNMRVMDYHRLNELAHWRRASIVDTINRGVEIARRVYVLTSPDPRWAHLPPEDQPPPGYLVAHYPQPDGTEKTVEWQVL